MDDATKIKALEQRLIIAEAAIRQSYDIATTYISNDACYACKEPLRYYLHKFKLYKDEKYD